MINVHLADVAVNNWLAVKLTDLLSSHDVEHIFYVGTLHLPEANFPVAYCTSSHKSASSWNPDWTIEDSFVSALIHFACHAEINISLLVTKSFQRPGDRTRQQAIDTLIEALRGIYDEWAPKKDFAGLVFLLPKTENVDNFLLYK